MRAVLADLLPLLQSVADIEQSKFAKINSEIDRLRLKIDQITVRKTTPCEQLTIQNNWEKWSASEKARINQKLALAMSEREHQKQILSKAVGRTEALKHVAKRDG